MRVDDAGDAGGDQRVRAGAGAPVWLHGSSVTTAVAPRAAPGASLRKGVGLGVRGARAAVPALGEHVARRGDEQDAADLRVDAARARAGRASRARRIASRSAAVAVIRHPLVQTPGRLTDRGAHVTPPVLPPIRTRSSILLHHRRFRSSTGSASARTRSDADASARGLSPPVRILTDPGAHFLHFESTQRPDAEFIPCLCMKSVAVTLPAHHPIRGPRRISGARCPHRT